MLSLATGQRHPRGLADVILGRTWLEGASSSLQPHAHTHPYSPSGQKVPGVLQGQQDPGEKCQEQGTGVRATLLGSGINTNEAWFIGGDRYLSPSHQAMHCLSLTGAPGGPGSPWPPCWREKESDWGEALPPHQGN